MTYWDGLRSYLPAVWLEALQAAPRAEQVCIQELRLRADQPITVSTTGGERYLCPRGLTELRQPGVYLCRREQLELCFMRFCEQSVYAHEWELRQGYLSVPGGIRVGVAGTAVTEDGTVRAVCSVTALCVRLPRPIAGCAAGLQRVVLSAGRPISTLLVGPPSSGKTTLLRDLAVGLAARHQRVAVVDERGELSGLGGLSGCDVLRGYPKAQGIRQAVRCLAPDAILFDELGGEEEVQAVAACAHAGVAVVASLHGYSPWELERQPLSRMLIRRRSFAQWVFLTGRHCPGVWEGIYAPEEQADEVDWIPVDDNGRMRDGGIQYLLSASARTVFAEERAGAAEPFAADDLYGPPYSGAVAAFSRE